MWSNGDVSGGKTAKLFIGFSICLMVLVILGSWTGLFPWLVAILHTPLVIFLMVPVLRYKASGERGPMRKAFFGTLLYLPVILLGLAFAWS